MTFTIKNMMNISTMEITRKNLMELVERRRLELGWSKRRIATESEVPYSNIIDFYRGETQIFKADRLQKILSALGITSNVRVPITGKITSGGNITLFESNAMSQPEAYTDSPPGVDYTPTLKALLVEDDLGWVSKGWEIHYDNHTQGGCFDLNTSVPHLVKTKSAQILLGKVRRGYSPGKYNIITPTAEILEDIEIEWSARVKAIVPK